MPDALFTPEAAPRPKRVRRLLGVVKLLLAVGILGYLFYRLRADNVFQRLVDEPKNWGVLAIAQVLVLGALTLNYVRWYVLGHALGLNFTVRDAFRLGALGLLLNQVSPGSLGGDLFKAVFIAREQPGKRTEAVASVLIDRVVGMYAMLLMASAGYAVVSRSTEFKGLIRGAADAVVVCAVIGTVGIGLLMVPAFTGPAMRGFVARLPAIGGTLGRLVDAGAAYRRHKSRLFAAILIGCCTHVLFALAFWNITRGLPLAKPALAEMFVVTPLSMAAGTIPLTPSGLGIAEGAAGKLFQSAGYPEGDGFLVGLTFRVMTYVMAGLGGVYYARARRTMGDVLQEAEDLAEGGEAQPEVGGP
jgi:glycosyltransferase 2 family protein